MTTRSEEDREIPICFRYSMSRVNFADSASTLAFASASRRTSASRSRSLVGRESGVTDRADAVLHGLEQRRRAGEERLRQRPREETLVVSRVGAADGWGRARRRRARQRRHSLPVMHRRRGAAAPCAPPTGHRPRARPLLSSGVAGSRGARGPSRRCRLLGRRPSVRAGGPAPRRTPYARCEAWRKPG